VPFALLLVLVLAAAAAAAVVAYLASRGNDHGACRGAQLDGHILDSTGAAGTIVLSITLTNASSSACTLEGYPDLQLEDAGGSQLPTQVEQGGGPAVLQHTPARVSLAPGDHGTLLLSYADVPTGTEVCPTAAALLIQPPGASDSVRVSVGIAPCGGRLAESPLLAGVIHAP
jgi:hypothetical protein